MRQGDRLAAILIGGNLRNDLGGNITGRGKRVGLLNQCAGNHRAILQHVIQIHQITIVHVLRIVIGIMEVNNSSIMSFHDFLRKQNTVGDVLTHLACHVVTLYCVDGGILVGVFLFNLLVVRLDQRQNPIICGIGLSGQAADIAIGNILFGNLKGTMCHNCFFHKILNFLYGRAAAHFLTGNPNAVRNPLDLQRGHANFLIHNVIGFGNSHYYFIDEKLLFRTISLNNLHKVSSSCFL